MRKWIRKVLNDETIRENFPLYIAHLEKYNYITLDHEDQKNWGHLILSPSSSYESKRASSSHF